jgi:beta-phosphoglucomutase-like phosphatase (HAD superfamily)
MRPSGMSDDPVDLDDLVGAWRSAFGAAEEALHAAGRDHDLTASELGARFRNLSDERAATVRALSPLALDHHVRPLLVRLVASSTEAKRLLGLPAEVDACVFNVDGVLIASAAIHADAWKETFDHLVSRRVERTGGSFAPFSQRVDYPALIHGKSREHAVRDFLASRGISLPEGRPDDSLDAETVRGLANRKSSTLLRRLEQRGVNAYAGARLYLRLAQDARLHCAVVSGSTHTEVLLERARLDGLVAECIDGRTALAEGLKRKPAPDMLLAACRHLGVQPARSAVFETTEEGVLAGRAGGFRLVVAVHSEGNEEALRGRGADVVVADLGEMVEHQLAS